MKQTDWLLNVWSIDCCVQDYVTDAKHIFVSMAVPITRLNMSYSSILLPQK